MHSTEQETRAGRACGGPDKTAREDAIVLCPIARIRTAFPTKFGIPRQSGIVPSLPGKIVFAREFAQAEALRGIGEYSHLWLVWQFSAALREHWSATVRPPRLGGNTRVGVFATRSPFRPNGLGLSSVRLERVEWDTPDGPVLHVSGVDLMDGTPILDIKPYLPSVDCHADATGGFTDGMPFRELEVWCPGALLDRVPASLREALLGVLRQDPRPHYQEDPDRIYGFGFGGFEVKFRVRDGILAVLSLERNGDAMYF